MQVAEDTRQVDDRADVGAIEAASSERGSADSAYEIRVRPRGERLHHRLAMAIIKNERVGVARQARGLFFDGFVEALLLEANAESAREQDGMLLQRFRIDIGNRFYVGEIFFQARAIEAGLIQILRSANENAGSAANRRTKSAEVAAGFGREKQQGLLGVLRNGDDGSFFAHLPGPGFEAGEPMFGRRIGGATQERDDEKITGGLIGRKIRMQPEAVAGLQVGDFRNWQRFAVAGDLHFAARPEQIEGVIVGARQDWSGNEHCDQANRANELCEW